MSRPPLTVISPLLCEVSDPRAVRWPVAGPACRATGDWGEAEGSSCPSHCRILGRGEGTRAWGPRVLAHGVPFVAHRLLNSTSIHEEVGLVPNLSQWVKDPVLP